MQNKHNLKTNPCASDVGLCYKPDAVTPVKKAQVHFSQRVGWFAKHEFVI